MKKIEFRVKGSGKEPYKVVFEKNNASLKCLCDCKAAVNGTHCKHRLNILKGEKTDIVSDNSNQVDAVIKWLENTDLEQALNTFYIAESNADEAKKQLSKAKKELAKAMR